MKPKVGHYVLRMGKRKPGSRGVDPQLSIEMWGTRLPGFVKRVTDLGRFSDASRLKFLIPFGNDQ
jgi:hypothetical protein